MYLVRGYATKPGDPFYVDPDLRAPAMERNRIRKLVTDAESPGSVRPARLSSAP